MSTQEQKAGNPVLAWFMKLSGPMKLMVAGVSLLALTIVVASVSGPKVASPEDQKEFEDVVTEALQDIRIGVKEQNITWNVFDKLNHTSVNFFVPATFQDRPKGEMEELLRTVCNRMYGHLEKNHSDAKARIQVKFMSANSDVIVECTYAPFKKQLVVEWEK
jgi:hypothetical protein